MRWRCDDACRVRAPRGHPADGRLGALQVEAYLVGRADSASARSRSQRDAEGSRQLLLTTLGQVEAAARRRGVWVDTDTGEPGEEAAVLVVTRHALSQLFGRRAPVPTAHPYALETPETAYLHCPACEHIAPGEDADYAPADTGRAELTEPVVVTCSACGYRTDTRPYAVIRTHPHRCPRCGGTTRAPWSASRVACQCCGRWFRQDAQVDLLASRWPPRGRGQE